MLTNVMLDKNLRYKMHGTVRAVAVVPVVAFNVAVGWDAVHMGMAKFSSAKSETPEDLQAQASHINSSLQKTFMGNGIVEKCTTAHPDDTAGYIQCAKDSIHPATVSLEIGLGIFAAYVALPLFNHALAYFRLAKNVQEGTLVHNFPSIVKKTVDESSAGDVQGISKIPSSKKPVEAKPRFKIKNGLAPIAEIVLKENETVYTERGAMIAMDQGIFMSTAMMVKSGALFSGESIIQNSFQSSGFTNAKLVITPKNAGEIVEIDLAQEHRILCDNGAFFASLGRVDIGFILSGDKSMRSFSGMGRIVQTITQSEDEDAEEEKPSRVLLSSSGQIYSKKLERGQELSVQGSSVLAMSDTVRVSLKEIYGGRARFLGGEGKFLLNIHGPGKVWLQSEGPQEQENSGGGIFNTIRGLLPF